MASGVRIPRSRGTLCGLALVLLGGWGGVAPLAGPSFGYGFTPDQAWDFTHSRLYLSVLPGAVVLVAGLIVMVTRSRAVGGCGALIAALGGAWFIAGAALVRLLPAGLAGSISAGVPLGTGASTIVLTGLTFYAGVGALIVFFAALALGRFSIAAYKDHDSEAADVGAYSDQQGQPGQSQYQPGQSQYQPGQTQDFPAPAQYPGQYPAGPGAFPPDQYTTTPEQYPPHDPFGLTQEGYPTSQAPFPPAPNPFPSGQDPAAATQTGLPRPYGQPDPEH